MTLDFGLLAEAAVSKGGHVSILTTFDRFTAEKFPFVVPQMSLVLWISGHPSEIGQHAISVELVDADGHRPAGAPVLNASLNLGANPEGAWETPRGALVLNFQGMKFLNPNTYTFVVKVDGKHAGDVKFYVKQEAQQAAA